MKLRLVAGLVALAVGVTIGVVFLSSVDSTEPVPLVILGAVLVATLLILIPGWRL